MNDENLKPCKKEETHNPNGRPKGRKNFKTIYKKFLKMKMKAKDSDYEIPFIDENKEISLQEMIVLRHIKKALGKADYKDIEMIINRVDGLLKQEIEHSGSINTEETINKLLKTRENHLRDKLDEV